ncbi:MAG: ferritin-like domain-containing protein [Ilumatobacteraceae bacterium]|nr:ferritin-like domain-containing protein [Ilumatobacteraceae bacterium]
MTEPGAFAELSDDRQPIGRRAAVRVGAGVGLGGAALTLLPFLGGRAAASATTEPATTEPASTEAATTTTAPPQRPTPEDVTLLRFAQQVEATAVALYNEALKVTGWSDEQALVVKFIRDAHLAYAQSLSGLLGRDAPNSISQEVFATNKAAFSGAIDEVLASAGALESTAVATHGDVIAKLVGTDAASLIASIQINEARYCTVLANLAGETDLTVLLVDEEAASLVGEG